MNYILWFYPLMVRVFDECEALFSSTDENCYIKNSSCSFISVIFIIFMGPFCLVHIMIHDFDEQKKKNKEKKKKKKKK